MGTRGTTGITINGVQMSQYQQYDSYLDGVGLDVLNFVRGLASSPEALAEARDYASKLKVVHQSGVPTPAEREALGDKYHQDVSSGNDWYAVLRETQGNLALILQSGYIVDGNPNFLNEEYDYLVDLDDHTLTAWAYGKKLGCFPFDGLPSDEEWSALEELID